MRVKTGAESDQAEIAATPLARTREMCACAWRITNFHQDQQFATHRSEFAAPLILFVSDAGEVIKAYRPEPLANGLMTLLKGRNAKLVGKCSVCGKLFQRLRRDQKCDIRRCRDTLRQRRHRARVRRRQVKSRRSLKMRAKAER